MYSRKALREHSVHLILYCKLLYSTFPHTPHVLKGQRPLPNILKMLPNSEVTEEISKRKKSAWIEGLGVEGLSLGLPSLVWIIHFLQLTGSACLFCLTRNNDEWLNLSMQMPVITVIISNEYKHKVWCPRSPTPQAAWQRSAEMTFYMNLQEGSHCVNSRASCLTVSYMKVNHSLKGEWLQHALAQVSLHFFWTFLADYHQQWVGSWKLQINQNEECQLQGLHIWKSGTVHVWEKCQGKEHGYN